MRLEKVVLDLDDGGFSTKMAKNAAVTALLERALKSLDGTSVDLTADMDGVSKATDKATKSTKEYSLETAIADEQAARLKKSLRDQAKAHLDAESGAVVNADAIRRVGNDADRTSSQIDRLSGRLAIWRDATLIAGPGAIPILATAVPAVAGLAAQLGAAALAGGTMVIAMQGVGDALKAVNEAALEPTAENLAKARDELSRLGPDARQFVLQLQQLRPVFADLRNAAGEGLFPGLSAAFDQFESVAPRLESVLTAIGGATGDVVNDFATGLAGSRGQEFLAFIEAEVPGALAELGATMANFTAGLAELWMAFTPLNNDFSAWLLRSSEAFDEWASGLSQTQGFEDFISYIRENGPRVAEAMGALGNALVQIVTAAAPLGGPVLQAIEGIADAIALVAGSDAGPAIMAAVTAMTLLTRVTQGYERVGKTAWAQAISGSQGLAVMSETVRTTAIRTAAGIGLLATSMTDLDEKAGLSNTAMGALAGTMIAPGWGTAVGTAIGLIADLGAANDNLVAALQAADDAIYSMDVGQMQSALENLNQEYAEQIGFTQGLRAGIPGLSGAYDTLFGKTDEVEAKQRALNVAMAASEGKTTSLSSATLRLRDVADVSAAKIERQAEALREARKAAADTAQGFINLGDAVDDGKRTLNQFLNSLERQAEDLRNFRKNAETAAKKGLEEGLIRQLAELGPLGARQMAQLANASERELGRANTAFRQAQREPELLRDLLLRLDGMAPRPKVSVDTSGVSSAVAGVVAALNAIPDETVRINVVRGATAGAALGAVPRADGGTVPGVRQPYGDKTLILAAPGEEIITNKRGEADRFRADRAAGRIPAYANGGTVAAPSTRWATPRPVVNVGATTVAAPAVRVFIGERELTDIVRVQIDGAERFKRRLDDRD